MKTGAWGRVQRLSAFVLVAVMQGCSQSSVHTAGAAGVEYRPVLKSRKQPIEMQRQQVCADQVVTRLARRDRLDRYVFSQEVQLEPRYRIRVFFQFRDDMRSVLPKLGRFWKFPRWIGGGRYASSYGQGQPGFELHLDQEDPTRTVGLNALKSSDVDDHEPAGDLKSIALHAVNVVQHKLGRVEKAPCDLLAALSGKEDSIPASVSTNKHDTDDSSEKRNGYVDENMRNLQEPSLQVPPTRDRSVPVWLGVEWLRSEAYIWQRSHGKNPA